MGEAGVRALPTYGTMLLGSSGGPHLTSHAAAGEEQDDLLVQVTEGQIAALPSFCVYAVDTFRYGFVHAASGMT